MIPTATRKILRYTSTPFFFAIIPLLALLNIPTVFELPLVLTVENALLLAIVPVIIVSIALRIFARSQNKRANEEPGLCLQST